MVHSDVRHNYNYLIHLTPSNMSTVLRNTLIASFCSGYIKAMKDENLPPPSLKKLKELKQYYIDEILNGSPTVS